MTTLEKINLTQGASNVSQMKPNTGSSSERQGLATSGKSLPTPTPAALFFEAQKKELDQAVESVSSHVQNITRELNFSVDEELDRFVVTVIDRETGELVRQIPTEEMLELAKTLSQFEEKEIERGYKGILFHGDV